MVNYPIPPNTTQVLFSGFCHKRTASVSMIGCKKVQAKSGILIISYPLFHYDRFNVFLKTLCD